MVKPFATALGVLLAFLQCGHAQEAALIQAFSGQWFSFEPSRAASTDAGTPCAVTLSVDAAAGGGFEANTQDCAPPLDRIALWGIIDGQIRLVGTGQEIAALGGHQLRMTGDIGHGGGPLVLERASGDSNAQAIRQAVATYRCFFAGYGDTCAHRDQLAMPRDVDKIVTLVDLNVRAQPRADADVQNTIARNTVLSVDTCIIATDGPWCRTTIDGAKGWVARNALRGETWPVITFTPVR